MKLYLNIVAFFSLQSIARCQVHFDCPQLPPLAQPAKTVHELRPQDIKVIMTLGDSVTAGSHMYTVTEVLPVFMGASLAGQARQTIWVHGFIWSVFIIMMLLQTHWLLAGYISLAGQPLFALGGAGPRD